MLSDFYNIILIPKDHSRIRRFRVSRRKVTVIGASVGLFVLFAVGCIAGLNYYHTEYVATLELREKGQLYEKERAQFMGRLEDLEEMVDRAEKLASRLEVAAGIGDRSPTLASVESPSLRPVSLDLSFESNSEVGLFDETTLKRIDLKASQLQKEAGETEERLKEIYEFKPDSLYFWSSVPSIWPVRGWITSDFGVRRSPLSGGRHIHSGIDIASNYGAAVRATGDGVVSYAGRYGGYGNMIVIEHGYGVASVYSHNSHLLVKEGDEVKRGMTVGRVGSTGRSTGPHLHYEVHVNGIAVDPLKYILE